MPQHHLSLLHRPQLSDASCSKTALWVKPRNPEWSWQLKIPLGCIVNLDAATVKHRTKFFSSLFFFFLRVVVVSHGRVPGLQLHLLACLCFLAPPGFSRIRFIYILKPREELSRCHANLSGWLSWNCVALIWWLSWSLQSLHSAHRRKYFLKSASFFHFNMFSSIFLSHSFSDTELAQWRKQAIVKHFIWHHRHIY